MFLRATKRKKDGKEHRYWSVVENVRPASGPAHQKTLLYLGDLNDSQHAAWTKALTVFNTDSGQAETRSLFPSDRTPPLTAAPALSLCLGDYALSRPRQYGACWLACDLWRQLGLDQFWADKLPPSREGTDWARLLQVSVAYRLIAPGSEWRCHRQWYDQSAMGDLLGPDFRWGGKDQLYFVLDRLLEHRPALFTHLQKRWQDLFGAKYEVLLYDLTSTYVEGQAEEIPKAQFGHNCEQARLHPQRFARSAWGQGPALFSSVLRSDAGQHLGQDNPAGVSGQNRKTIRQSLAHLDHGSNSHFVERGCVADQPQTPTKEDFRFDCQGTLYFQGLSVPPDSFLASCSPRAT